MPALNPTFTVEELQSEEWRLCVRFPLYEVSDLGRVRRQDTQQVLKQWPNGHGYPYVSINRKTIRVHPLIAAAFICGPRSPKTEVNHVDAIKTNNRARNLEYLSPSAHLRHTVENHRHDSGDLWEKRHKKHCENMRGEKHPLAEITEEQAREVKRLRREGLTCRQISDVLQISWHIVRSIAANQSWKYVK